MTLDSMCTMIEYILFSLDWKLDNRKDRVYCCIVFDDYFVVLKKKLIIQGHGAEIW